MTNTVQSASHLVDKNFATPKRAVESLIGTAKGDPAKEELETGRGRVQSILSGFSPTGFQGGGLTGGFKDGQFSLTRGAELTGALDEVGGAFRRTSSDFRDLAGQVTPGFGRLTKSRLQQVESARRRSIGNLRENLQRRRVSGSSFGQDAITRGELEFTREANRVEAESFIQELQLNAELLGKANEAEVQRATTMLGQLNFESGLAAELGGQVNEIMAANTQLHAKLTAELAGARAGVDANNQEFLQSLAGTGATLGIGKAMGIF